MNIIDLKYTNSNGKRIVIFICGLLSTLLLPCAKAEDAAAIAKKEGQPARVGDWGLAKAEIKDPSLPRVLLVGDSIAAGYSRQVVKQLEGKANVDAWITPQWLCPLLNKLLTDILKENRYDVIHFNESGLHAWAKGRIADGQYGPLMRSYLDVYKTLAPQARLIWATTTPVTIQGKATELDPEVNALIVERNELCRPIMQEYGIAVDDLYTLMEKNLNLGVGDRCHWNRDGFDLLAKTVVGAIQPALSKP